MAPLKIKGFVPKAGGEIVMMPLEITLLSGSDFDIDKMYIMLKDFGITKEDNEFFEKTDLTTRTGRNNRIFDLQWAVLTNEDTSAKMFNPGSFNVQKKISKDCKHI